MKNRAIAPVIGNEITNTSIGPRHPGRSVATVSGIIQINAGSTPSQAIRRRSHNSQR
jgi:hypothetical protein